MARQKNKIGKDPTLTLRIPVQLQKELDHVAKLSKSLGQKSSRSGAARNALAIGIKMFRHQLETGNDTASQWSGDFEPMPAEVQELLVAPGAAPQAGFTRVQIADDFRGDYVMDFPTRHLLHWAVHSDAITSQEILIGKVLSLDPDVLLNKERHHEQN